MYDLIANYMIKIYYNYKTSDEKTIKYLFYKNK